MTMWAAVLLGCAVCFALKYAGYITPGHWLGGERISRVTVALPIALLAALIAVQTFTGPHGQLRLDARLAGVLVALVALRLRANFIVVVALAALTAALVRAAGLAG